MSDEQKIQEDENLESVLEDARIPRLEPWRRR